MIDWKSLVPAVTKWIVLTVLTVIATKWADAAEIIARLNSGQTVPLWHGTINLSLDQLQLWISTGIIALVGAALSWFNRAKLKREAATALQLPKGATATDVKKVSEESNPLSAVPNPAALNDVIGNLRRAGIQ